MGKMKELDQILDEMIEAGQNMIEAATSIKEYFSSEDEAVPVQAEKESRPLSKEEVRKLLAEKSSQDEGRYRSEVKSLIRKYSESGSLSGVNPEQYESLISELEVIGNA